MRSGKLMAGRFLLQERLGSGPLGSTFQGVDQSTGQRVVVKLLDGQRVPAGKLPKAFQTIHGGDVPGLVRYVAHGFEEGSWFLVRPWLDGDTVDMRLWRDPLPWTEALQIVREVARVVAGLHRRNLAHLGLGPSNLLVSGGQVMVLDAGVAYLESTVPRLRLRPSQDFQADFAPEQVRVGRSAGARADVFALGVMLRELTASRPPFLGSYPMAALGRLMCCEPPPLRSLAPNVPAWAEELLDALLAKDPERRPHDAEALLKLLDAGAERAPQTPRLPGFGEKEQRVQALLMLGGRWLHDRPDAVAQADLLARALTSAGFAHDRLADGTLLAVTSPSAALADQLQGLARAALEAKRKFPRAPMALVAGRGESRGRLQDGDLLDRTAALLLLEGRRTEGSDLRIDKLVSALLPGWPTGTDDIGHLLGSASAPPSSRRATPAESDEESDDAADREEREADSTAGEVALAAGQGRLDTIGLPQCRALRAASIFIGCSWRSGVEEVLGEAIDWRSLLDLGLLRPRLPSKIEGEVEFEFVEDELREIAYGSLTEDDRGLGHRRAAAWLERKGQPVVDVVVHWERSHDLEGFVGFCLRAAQQALAQSDPEEALRWLDRGESSGLDGLGDLLRLRGSILVQLGQRAQARRGLIRALESTLRDSPEYFRSQGELLETCGLVGDLKRYTSTAERMNNLSPRPELRVPWATTLAQGVAAALRLGKVELAETMLHKASEVAQASGDARLRGQLLRARALRAKLTGYPAANLNLCRAASVALRASEQPALAYDADVELAAAYLDAGVSFDAEQLATQTLGLARKLALAEVEARCKIILGLALQRRANYDVARTTIREASSFFGGRGNKLFEGEARCALAAILLAWNDLDGARREAERAQGALAPFPAFQIQALAILAQAQLALGQAEDAARTCDQAQAVVIPLGALVDVEALLRPIRAQLHRLAGERDEARRLLLATEQALTERARSFEDPTMRDAYLRHVPEHARVLQLARLISIPPPPPDEDP